MIWLSISVVTYSSCHELQKFTFHIFHDAVFPTANLHTMHVLHVYPQILNLHPILAQQTKRCLRLKITF